MVKMIMNNRSGLKRFGQSTKNALNGINYAIKTELHFRYHLIAVVAVVILGLITPISRVEWLIIAMLVGGVLMSELFNTALEKLTDLVSPEQQPDAGLVKDLAAGAVLILALIAALVGSFIFVPKYFTL